jgi:hypothetical protein
MRFAGGRAGIAITFALLAHAALVTLRISVMVISRFGERDQFGRWCCAVNGL